MKLIPESNLPILDALTLMSPGSSKTTLRSWIKEGRVQVDGAPVKTSDRIVAKGQTISIGPKSRFLDAGLKVLYEDNHLVVIDKPEGLLSVATNFEKGETAHAFLKKNYRPKVVFVVHRLDQDTSGVMLFALTPEARDGFKKMFEKHDMHRQYIAIVEGRFEEPKGTWESFLVEDSNYVVRSTEDENHGQRALTHYIVRASKKGYSWLDVTLETGRKNQIRVHCQDAGHPIVGDKKYGAVSNPIKRLCLHSHVIGFKHPVTDKPLQFTSPVPDSFYKILQPLE